MNTKNNHGAITLSIQDAEEFFDYKVAQGVARGLEDVKNGNFTELTPSYAQKMKEYLKRLSKNNFHHIQ